MITAYATQLYLRWSGPETESPDFFWVADCKPKNNAQIEINGIYRLHVDITVSP